MKNEKKNENELTAEPQTHKRKKANLAAIVLPIVIGTLLLCYVGFTIYVWIRYGNAPRDETPNWVWWFMWNR